MRLIRILPLCGLSAVMACGADAPGRPRAPSTLPALASASPPAPTVAPGEGVVSTAESEIPRALEAVEALLAGAQKEQKIPGMSVAIVQDQQILWAKGFGHSDVEHSIPASADTVYRIASITKVFTATMLMQLRDAGKLGLDDAVEKYLPEFQIASRFPGTRPISFRQIAAHVSGLPHEADLPYAYRPYYLLRDGDTNPPITEMIASLKDLELSYPPLTQMLYSNLGYNIMGHALSKIAGEPYERYVEQHILRPLGMENSGFELTGDMKARLAVGYHSRALEPTPEGQPPVRVPFVRASSPASGLFSTVRDAAKLISLQFRDGPAAGSQILSGQTLREMREPYVSHVGIGWHTGRMEPHGYIEHTGAHLGFTTVIRIVPELKLGIAVFINAFPAGAKKMAEEALKAMFPAIQALADQQKAAASKAVVRDFRRYEGTYRLVDPGPMKAGGVQRLELTVRADGDHLSVRGDNPQTVHLQRTMPDLKDETVLAPVAANVFQMEEGNFGFVGPVFTDFVTFEPGSGERAQRMRWRKFVFERRP